MAAYMIMHFVCNKYSLANLLQGKFIVLSLSDGSVVKQDRPCSNNLVLRYCGDRSGTAVKVL